MGEMCRAAWPEREMQTAERGVLSLRTSHSALRISVSAVPPEGGDLMSPSMASVPCVASVQRNTFEVA
jgi:hypothetical protein